MNDMIHFKQTIHLSLLSRDFWMIERIKQSLAPLAHPLCVYSDEVELLRIVREGKSSLLLFDAQCTSPTHSGVLAWQRCYGDSPLPLIVIGDFLSADLIFSWYKAGAIDVLCAPFNTDELLVRATLAIRTQQQTPTENPHIRVGPYFLDRDDQVIYFHGQPIRLTTREFAIAWLFFSNPNICFRRSQLAQAIWGRHTDLTDRTMEQHIYKLRKKLFLQGRVAQVRIRTLYSHGYKLELRKPLPPLAGRERPIEPVVKTLMNR